MEAAHRTTGQGHSATGGATRPKILIVDDDEGIRESVSAYLVQHGFDVGCAANGVEMARARESGALDLIILDLMLPGDDGLALCRQLVASDGPPVIMLSAHGQDHDRIIGLEVGADDYLGKPCNPRELLARVRAVLRRRGATNGGDAAGSDAVIGFDGWTLRLARRELRNPDGVLISLTHNEFSLLQTFLDSPQRILSRNQLLDAVQGEDAALFDRTVDAKVSRLRRKLAFRGKSIDVIQTVRSEGYKFVARVVRT